MENIKLASTDDLLDELFARFDHAVFTGMKITKANGEYLTFRKWQGNRAVGLGLMCTVQHLMAKEEITTTIPLERNNDK
jgi:hypothetical protein